MFVVFRFLAHCIRIVKNGQLLDQPFLDIAAKVSTSGSERGLLGLAFHPDYKTNGQFFVDYTREPEGATAAVKGRDLGAESMFESWSPYFTGYTMPQASAFPASMWRFTASG